MQLTTREATGREPPTLQEAMRRWCLCVRECACVRAHVCAPPSVYVSLCLCAAFTGYLTVIGGRFPTSADGTQQ